MTESVCDSGWILVLRSAVWPIVLFVGYDCIRRFGYLRQTWTRMPRRHSGDHPYEPRTALRRNVQDVLTPLGYAFSKWVHPEERVLGGNPSGTNFFVNVVAVLGVVAGIAVIPYLLGTAYEAVQHRAWTRAAIELAVAVASTLVSLRFSRPFKTRGLVRTFGAVVAGALVGGVLAGYLLCTPSQSRAVAASARIDLNI